MELTLWYAGEVEPKDTVGACVTTPTLKDVVSVSEPEPTVMMFVWTVAVGAMVRVAVAVVTLVTVNLLTVMPEPAGKVAVVKPGVKVVFSPVTVTGTDWPCIPDAGATLTLSGSGGVTTGGVGVTVADLLLPQPEIAKVSKIADTNSEIFLMRLSLFFPGYSAHARQCGEESDERERLLSTAWRGERMPVIMCISILIACERVGETNASRRL
jgi:hypothetical protein